MDCINSLESTCNVPSWQVNGLRIWPFVRIWLSILIRDHDFVGPQVEPESRVRLLGLLQGFSRSVISILHLILQPAFWAGFPAVVLTKPSGSPGGFNIYSDPLRAQLRLLGISSLAIEVSYRPRRLRWGDPILLLDRHWLSLSMRILYGLLRICQPASCDLPGLESARRQVRRCFPSLDCKALSRHSLVREATYLQAYRLFFSLLLGRLRPRQTFIICYYSLLAMGFILAARRQRALSADYQHGVQGKFHYAYGSWLNFPTSGYELLPDVFLNWSEDEKLAIEQWAASSPHRSIVVGNLLTDHMQKRMADSSREYEEYLRCLGDKPRVLYSLQNYIPPGWVWDAIRESSPHFKWLIRLHPQYQKLRQVVLENLAIRDVADYELEQASLLPLPFLLPNITVHVTGNSSVVLAALQAGKPSIVIDHYGQEYYSDLIAAGKVAAALNPPQLLQALRDAIARAPGITSHLPSSSLADFLQAAAKPPRRKSMGAA